MRGARQGAETCGVSSSPDTPRLRASHSLCPSLFSPPSCHLSLALLPSLLLSPLPCPGPWHQVDRAIAACAELHDLKEVVLENQKELEGVRLESLAQVRRGELLLWPEPGSLVRLGLPTGFS